VNLKLAMNQYLELITWFKSLSLLPVLPWHWKH